MTKNINQEKINLSVVSTENINPNTIKIDELETFEMLKTINDEDKKVPLAIEKELENITKAVDIIYDKVRNKGRLVYIGAGTSGRLGVLDASECPPTFGVDDNVIIGIMAGGDSALRKAVEGAEDSLTLAEEDLRKINFSSNDVLMGIAASGRTPYVIGGLKYAQSLGSKTIGLCNSKENKLDDITDVNIVPLVGGEVVTGSTRMKAGTSQKLILNMITTSVMIKLGKVYGNLMVDVQALNEKLVERQINILLKATDCPRETAIKTLKLTNNDCKLAIFIILSNLSMDIAQDKLNESEGRLKIALQNI